MQNYFELNLTSAFSCLSSVAITSPVLLIIKNKYKRNEDSIWLSKNGVLSRWKLITNFFLWPSNYSPIKKKKGWEQEMNITLNLSVHQWFCFACADGWFMGLTFFTWFNLICYHPPSFPWANPRDKSSSLCSGMGKCLKWSCPEGRGRGKSKVISFWFCEVCVICHTVCTELWNSGVRIFNRKCRNLLERNNLS